MRLLEYRLSSVVDIIVLLFIKYDMVFYYIFWKFVRNKRDN